MTGQGAEKLGYLGLGMMGFPMARRLLNAGHDVVVWNRSAARRLYWSRLVRSLRPIRATSRATPVSFSCACHRRNCCGVSRVRSRRSCGSAWRWKAGRGFFIDPSGRGSRYRCATKGRQRHGMGRRPALPAASPILRATHRPPDQPKSAWATLACGQPVVSDID